LVFFLSFFLSFFSQAATALERESGVHLQSELADQLVHSIATGDWSAAERCLANLQLAPSAADAVFWLREQRYLELLDANLTDVATPLAYLRAHLAPLNVVALAPRLHLLSSLVLAADAVELRTRVAAELPRNGSSAGLPDPNAPPDAHAAGANDDPAVIAAAVSTSALTLAESDAGVSGLTMLDDDGAAAAPGSTATAAASTDARIALAPFGAEPPLVLRSMVDRRAHVLDLVRQRVPSDILLPGRRLETLVAQAVHWQLDRCELHNDASTDLATSSLLVDHRCDEHKLPCVAAVTLERHRDEVWHVAFSPDGDMLASASKDGGVIVWSVARVDGTTTTLRYHHALRGHRDAVAYVSWSADSKRLLSFSNDSEICIFDVASGKLLGSIHGAPAAEQSNSPGGTPPAMAAIGACCWLDAACERIAIAGTNHDVKVVRVADGRVLYSQPSGRVVDMAVVITQAKQILVYTISKLGDPSAQPRVIQERGAMTSLQLSPDGRYALVNVPEALNEWDLDTRRLVRAYRGQRQSRFVIRTCYGGARDAFVASGSEDSRVYVWRRSSGALVAKLVGHGGVVNAVSWNPRHAGMLASGSDDGTVRIWIPDAEIATEVRRASKSGQ
jgi:hypothetical protein